MYSKTLAYTIGLALGDGNLSNPNGRAVRLRITCDTNYPNLTQRIVSTLKTILPNNVVSVVRGGKTSYCNVSCYSNQWEALLGWQAKGGSKIAQQVRVPEWIKNNLIFTKECLKGLFETDGSVYFDRGYCMVNFVNVIEPLALDVLEMITTLKFQAKLYIVPTEHLTKYTIRIAKRSAEFIAAIDLDKS